MSKGPAWLLEQLPALVRDGVLDDASAARLRAHYAPLAASAGAMSRVLFATLGALLVGLGLILLAAHNWDQWGRGTRLFVSLLPLALSQGLLTWVLRRDADGGWREAAAVFSALAFALALAMVGQVFHFPGDLGRYLAVCAALTLPLVYVPGSALAAAVYGGAVLGSVLSMHGNACAPLLVVAAFAVLVPYLWVLYRREGATGARLPLLLWALAPLLFFAVLASLPDVPRLGLWWLAGFGALLALGDSAADAATAGPLWRRPLAAYGSLAVAAAALIGSFADAWRGWPDALGAVWQAWVLLFAVLGVVLWQAIQAARARRWVAALHAVPALLMALVVAFDTRAWAVALAAMLSGFVLLLGVAMLRDGLQTRHWASTSRGLFLVTLLVLLRFLDTDWSFTVRGLVFVGTGIAFIVASLWLRRRMASP